MMWSVKLGKELFLLPGKFGLHSFGTESRRTLSLWSLRLLYRSQIPVDLGQRSNSSVSVLSSWICWNCQKQNLGPKLSCAECKSIIEPKYLHGFDYFEMFGQEKTFDINTSKLSDSFKNLQRIFHPDKFSNKSKLEQEYSEHVSSSVNGAYKTLLRPLDRATYLLELNGKPFDETSSGVKMDGTFLMNIMETNERVSACKSIEEAKEIKTGNDQCLRESYELISKCFKKNDFDGALMCLSKLKYFVNIEERLKDLVLKFS